MTTTKFDYEPLLGPGRHEFDRSELSSRFARGFGTSRIELNFRLHELLDALEELGVACQVWINGSYLCNKPDPNDVDVVIIVWHETYNALSEAALDFLDEIMQPHFHALPGVDAFVCIEYPRGHELYEEDNPDQWADLFGIEHSGQWLKGFAVVYVEP
ncbi:DUF6932 family protein [Rhodosalinus halophilus]|uniref:DUF6932 family protein n=1 Tax=Rhodosalinus halophilus TaxID=2259333 RepID=UPI003B83223E